MTTSTDAIINRHAKHAPSKRVLVNDTRSHTHSADGEGSIENWWHKLSDQAQAEYLKLHPKSKLKHRVHDDHPSQSVNKPRPSTVGVNHTPHHDSELVDALKSMSPDERHVLMTDAETIHDGLEDLHPIDHVQALDRRLSKRDHSIIKGIFDGHITKYTAAVGEALRNVLKYVVFGMAGALTMGAAGAGGGLLFVLVHDLIKNSNAPVDFFKAWFERLRHRVVHRHSAPHRSSPSHHPEDDRDASPRYFSNLDQDRQARELAVLDELRGTLHMGLVSDQRLTQAVRDFKYQ